MLHSIQARADVVRIDGMPLVWVSRLLGLPVTKAHRSGFMDLVPMLMDTAAQRGWRIMIIGGRPGVAERAAAALRRRYPGLQLVTEHGFFALDDSDGQASFRLRRIKDEGIDIVLVGMGMPRQEQFLARYLEHIEAPVVSTCGAAFDYVAGEIPMAPRELSGLGLEWLFRLIAEPRRLWRRYLLEPVVLIPRLWEDIRNRRHGEESFYYVGRDEGIEP